jgi:tetratricopeptide (TPR) repeat protein
MHSPVSHKVTFLLMILLLLWGSVSHAQSGDDVVLAREYLSKGDYEKAASLYSRLANNNQQFDRVYPDYLKTLLLARNYKDAEKLVKKAIKRNAAAPSYLIDLGLVAQAKGDKSAAQKQFEKVLSQVNAANVLAIASAFEQNELFGQAEQAYLRGRGQTKNDSDFAMQLIQLYSFQKQTPKLIGELLNIVKADEEQVPFVQNMLQNNLRDEKEFEALEEALISNLQKYPDQTAYSQMLIWLYTQKKDFASALMQARSLDKRTKGGGTKVIELAGISLKNKDYESAIEGYEYVLKEYRASPYYPLARQRLINAREEQVRNTFPVDKEKIKALIGEYEGLLGELGKNERTVEVMKNMAMLHAFQLDQKDQATEILTAVVNTPRANPDLVAEAKISLGDIYLLKGEPWEATLLYSQVEKSHKETPVGHEAKLRNAKLNYYKGDFELAQAHLDILKLATSREIANDAMELSLLITDNTGLDTSTVAMEAYASADLLVFQNKFTEAMNQLDNMLQKFPGHSLTDEIHYKKANIYLQMGEFQKSVASLSNITGSRYQQDILGDDAYYLMAKIYEENLGEREKAKELYNELMVKFPGSTYVVDARRRFRKLRGDTVN